MTDVCLYVTKTTDFFNKQQNPKMRVTGKLNYWENRRLAFTILGAGSSLAKKKKRPMGNDMISAIQDLHVYGTESRPLLAKRFRKQRGKN